MFPAFDAFDLMQVFLWVVWCACGVLCISISNMLQFVVQVGFCGMKFGLTNVVATWNWERHKFNVKLFSLNDIEIARCSCHMSCDLLVAGSYQPSLTQVPAPRWVSCKELRVVVLRCPLHDIKVWDGLLDRFYFGFNQHLQFEMQHVTAAKFVWWW